MSIDWTPGEDTSQNKCANCGAQVSSDFARVFGDNENVAQACIECSTRGEIMEGDAA